MSERSKRNCLYLLFLIPAGWIIISAALAHEPPYEAKHWSRCQHEYVHGHGTVHICSDDSTFYFRGPDGTLYEIEESDFVDYRIKIVEGE